MEFTGSVAGGVAGMLNIKGDGDEVTITPVLTSGVKVATIILNEGKPDEESFDLYAPDGVSSYNDLSNKPSINGHTLSGNQSTSDLELFSGSYSDLSNKPTLNGAAIAGNMYSQIWDTTQDVIIGYCNGQPVYRRTYRNLTLSQYIDLGNVPEWSIFNMMGTIETNDEYESQYGFNEVLMIPNYLNSNYWFRIYYMNDGIDYTGSHHPILYFEYASETARYFDKIPLLFVDYQIITT